ncbi:MAG: YkoF family thiamine/hydroxymethylpyrimidine-binding protein [bacterium]
MLSGHVALYPLETTDSDTIINNSLKKLTDQGITTQVSPSGTYFSGSPEKVWTGLRQMFETAEQAGNEVSMVVTFTNSEK